jgi:hypothetical protein
MSGSWGTGNESSATWRCGKCGNTNAATSQVCLGCGEMRASTHEGVVEVGKHSFSSSDFKTLQFAPFWAFSAVASADGKVDEKEVKEYLSMVLGAQGFVHFLTREIVGSIARDYKNLWDSYVADPRSIEAGFTDVRRILETSVSREDALGFKKSLVAIGARVASASGGGFLGIGEKVSEQERVALTFVAVTLGLSPEDF